MNLTGLAPNRQFTLEVFGDTIKNSITRQGNVVALILKEIGRDLRGDGYTIEGSVHSGFTARKDGSTIQIEIS